MRIKQLWKSMIIVVCATLFALPSWADNETNQQNHIKNFVNSAVDYIKAHGKDAAIKEFNDKNGQFTKGDDYIFVIDFQGTMLANAYSPDLVGKNVMNLKDAKGKSLNHDLINKAKSGGGWVSYNWKNPATNKVQCKDSYTMPVDNSYLIGAGYYSSKSCQ